MLVYRDTIARGDDFTHRKSTSEREASPRTDSSSFEPRTEINDEVAHTIKSIA